MRLAKATKTSLSPVHPGPVPNYDCGKLAWMCESRHPDTAARAFYTCGDQCVSSCLSKVHCMFVQITGKFVELCYLG
jgi:hypothetical protein